ncbi:MAG TPA: glycosyltransferase family 2 protein [Candidatus Kapabacteria bacterium]|nr:glycosyltransferase family 2 protein [Candidatus Kapabacteria bacterium]
MKLSVVIPAHNEAECLGSTVERLVEALDADRIEHEIVVVDDNSTDATAEVLRELEMRLPSLRHVVNTPPHGFGFAVRRGLECFDGDAVAIVMADASDRPEDLVRYWRAMVAADADCVFGSRFIAGATIHDYPKLKLAMNRGANLFIRILFGLRYNDVTNAFKLYRRHVIEGLQPILSHHFNLTVELPLKSIVRGYRYVVLPSDWINRTTGVSKLRIKEMGSRYLFIVLYCFIERWLSRGDYARRPAPGPSSGEPIHG